MMPQNTNPPPSLSQWFTRLHIDLPLLVGIALCITLSLFILYSTSDRSGAVVIDQGIRFSVGLLCMVVMAQIPPDWYRTLAIPGYAGGLILLVLVYFIGDSSMGAQRWISVGPVRFQPSELMKIAVPLTVAAWFYHRTLPPKITDIIFTVVLIALPALLIIKQPDMGTALLVMGAGILVLYLAGLRWRLIIFLLFAVIIAAPFVWMHMHDYQQQRLLTFLNPLRDPSGAGYHIIQSKIAIGSGGLFGKGWLNGTQGNLNFLPEPNTDFIFSAFAEEAGFLGVLGLLALYLFLVGRGLYIAIQSQDIFQRLIAGSLSLTLFFYFFINIGMVAGLLPVVGVPLPLVSYGGTSMVIMLMTFGILMSIHTHRKLLAT